MAEAGTLPPTDAGHDPAGRAVPGALGSVGSALSAVVAAISGIAPHVLHHVGPLAGTALLAGTGGTILFGVAGFALSIPMLLRLRRRFGTWLAPAVASTVFLAVYLFSSLVVGPAVIGAAPGSDAVPVETPVPSDHEVHH